MSNNTINCKMKLKPRQKKPNKIKTMRRAPNIPKKEGKRLNMFIADSDSSASNDNANTAIGLEILQYLKDEDNTLEFLHR